MEMFIQRGGEALRVQDADFRTRYGRFGNGPGVEPNDRVAER